MPVFFLSLPELRSGASRLSGPRGSRWSACVWMSLHAFVSLPPCRLFIISASSFLSPPMFPCTFLRLLLAVAPVSPHLRLCLPRIFFLLAFPCLPTRLPQHLLRTFPRCLLIFLASSFFLPFQPPPPHLSPALSHAFLLVFPSIFFALFPAASLSSLRLPSFCRPSPPRIFPLRFSMPSPCRLYIYPCVLSSSLSHALREKSLCYDSGFSSDRDSFCLVSGKGASLRCVLFSCGRQGGLPPLLGIKFIYRCKCDFLQKMYFFDEKNREMLADSKKVPTFASAFEK